MGLIATYLTIFLMALHCKNLSHKTSVFWTIRDSDADLLPVNIYSIKKQTAESNLTN